MAGKWNPVVGVLAPFLIGLCVSGCGDDADPTGPSNDVALVGFWDVTSWEWTVDGVSGSYSESELDSLGLTWTLDLNDDGTAEQVTNLSGPMATMPGTWETSSNQLTLVLEGPTGGTGTTVYEYVVDNDTLTLDWSLEHGGVFSAQFAKR